jgi:riboflavin synthase
MFTGIVSEIGTVAAVARRGGSIVFTIRATKVPPDVAPGDSIAVNGVCQTVTSVDDDAFTFDSVAETLKRTNLSLLSQGSPVNLEPALRLGDRLSGHMVSGHIDSTGVIRSKRTVGSGNIDFAIQVPDNLRRFVRTKGSICLDGVSLTVKSIRGSMVEITIIPFTLESTIIKNWRVGTSVNVEVDQLAKYLTPEASPEGGG